MLYNSERLQTRESFWLLGLLLQQTTKNPQINETELFPAREERTIRKCMFQKCYCNCRQKNSCLLNGNCLQSSVIYQATVKRNDNNTSETYIGLTENAFKTRYRNHTASFRHTKHRNSTELSKHVWSLKDNNIDYSISWRIISSSSSYNSSSKRCNLCLKEKFLIICRPNLSSLNKRNELVSSCRHRNKALLCNN